MSVSLYCTIRFEYACFCRQVSIYAAYLYDAIYLYARALDEVINSGGDPYDGRAIVDSIRGRSFSSEHVTCCLSRGSVDD